MSKPKKKLFKSPAPKPAVVAADKTIEPEPKTGRWPLARLTALQASLILAVVGLAVFWSGLNGQFQGDDTGQIVLNTPAHSIGNLPVFFDGSTFYNGQGLAPLGGTYYRPLMTTAFALIYTFFGPNTFAFHFVQLLLYIGSAILLFLIFRYSFNPALSLMLSLIFLVHPLNSQVVFAIPSMQDVLFFFFGLLGLWLLLRLSSNRSLWVVAGCLFLSMLSKETAVVFIVVACLYLYWFNRERLRHFITIMALPVVVYLVLRIHAIGLIKQRTIAPIDNLSLLGRLFTAPSIVLFYITKLIFPWKLASAYYWVYPTFSIEHVLLPLILDAAFIWLVVWTVKLVRARASRPWYYTYLFFTIWAGVGLLPYLQIIPLDMTVCETWLYFSIAGVLGMIGVLLETLHVRPKWVLTIGIIIIAVFGIRSALRGPDWKAPHTLATSDLSVSKDNFIAASTLSSYYVNQNKFPEAEKYGLESVNSFPNANGYSSLGQAYLLSGNYPAASVALHDSLKYDNGYLPVYEMLAQLTLVYGSPSANVQFLLNANRFFPRNPYVWLYLAFLEYRAGSLSNAKIAITNAADYGGASQGMYESVINDQSFSVYLGRNKVPVVPGQ